MQLQLYRFRDTGQETFGILMVNGSFECFTLEDIYRYTKVKGKTRIPEGTYDITFHQSPKFSSTARNLSDKYIGMPMLENVPGFSYILIHWGNFAKDTDGCILVGRGISDHSIVHSRDAWPSLYKLMVQAHDAGEDIGIEIVDLED